MTCEHCEDLRSTLTDLTAGFKLLADSFKLVTESEVLTEKQIKAIRLEAADLRLELEAVKACRDGEQK